MINELIYSMVTEMNGARLMSAQLQEKVVELRDTPDQHESHVYDSIVEHAPTPDNPTPIATAAVGTAIEPCLGRARWLLRAVPGGATLRIQSR